MKLDSKERSRLEDLIRKGKTSARVQLRARILLHAVTRKQGSAWNDVQIAEALGTSLPNDKEPKEDQTQPPPS